MIDNQTAETLALVRDLAAGFGLPVSSGPGAEARFAALLKTLEALQPGAAARLRTGLSDRLHDLGAEARATGAVQ